jgi:hypothetical protein
MYELPKTNSRSQTFGYFYPKNFGGEKGFIEKMKKLDLFDETNSKMLIDRYNMPSGSSTPGKHYRSYLKNEILENEKVSLELRKAVAKNLCTRVPSEYEYLLK